MNPKIKVNAPLTQLSPFFIEHQQQINAALENLLNHRPPQGSERLLSAMKYSLLSGGKRIRPLLVYAACLAVHGTNKTPSPNSLSNAAACAVECIHAYSLIHDDLPAMDDDDLRRGQPTAHIQFDEATAILAGDALQTLAFATISHPELNAPAKQIKMLQILADAAGHNGMVGGQAIDFFSMDTTISLETLERMHRHKTGALIEAAVTLGAIAGDATQEQQERLSRYARAIGLSFQVQDDILDVTADTATLGKRQGADASLNKPTYVALLGLENAKQKARDLHHEAIEALDIFDKNAEPLRNLSSYIIERIS